MMAFEVASRGHRVGIVSLEDPKHLWGSRILSVMSGVSSNAMRRRQLSASDYSHIADALGRARRIGIHLAVEVGATVFQVVDTMRALVRDRGCSLVIVDYAQCLDGVEAASQHQAQKRMVTMIKSCAARNGVPLVLMSQIKRGDNPTREPTKYDLKEGGDLEIKSEYALMLWRTKEEPTAIHGKLDKSKVGGNGLRIKLAQRATGVLVEESADDFDDTGEPPPPPEQGELEYPRGAVAQ